VVFNISDIVEPWELKKKGKERKEEEKIYWFISLFPKHES